VRGVGSGQNPDLIPDEPSVLSQKWLTWPNFVADRNEYEHNRHWNPCWAGKLAITYTGDVMPCVMGRTQVVGNVRQQSLAAMLASPRLLDLWGLTKDQVAVCQHCEYRYVCGDCRPLAASGGDLHGAIPRCTYNPRLGDWGRPGISARRPGPASEGPEPEIALSVGVAEEAAFLSVTERGAFSRFRCEPDNAPPLASRYGPLHRRNHHFRCEPDR
jgi:radical SAM protein with 4Fe4S-binding SPASM domain